MGGCRDTGRGEVQGTGPRQGTMAASLIIMLPQLPFTCAHRNTCVCGCVAVHTRVHVSLCVMLVTV